MRGYTLLILKYFCLLRANTSGSAGDKPTLRSSVTKRTAASSVLPMILVWSFPWNFPLPKKSYCWVIAADLKEPEKQICDPPIDCTVILLYIVNTQRHWRERRKKGSHQTRKEGSRLERLEGWVTLQGPCAKGTKLYSNSHSIWMLISLL